MVFGNFFAKLWRHNVYKLAVSLSLGNRGQGLSSRAKSYDDRSGNALEYVRSDPFLAPPRGHRHSEALAEKIVPAQEFKGAKASR